MNLSQLADGETVLYSSTAGQNIRKYTCALQVRANALLEVGGSPTWTLTEDYALGMQLKKYGWHCRYVQEYLAIGEAPDQIRNCYQQRSRWCKARALAVHLADACTWRMPCIWGDWANPIILT